MNVTTVISVTVVPAIALYVAWQLWRIHKLVNSRLSEALHEIKRLGGDADTF
jgi:hypothetical protein